MATANIKDYLDDIRNTIRIYDSKHKKELKNLKFEKILNEIDLGNLKNLSSIKSKIAVFINSAMINGFRKNTVSLNRQDRVTIIEKLMLYWTLNNYAFYLTDSELQHDLENFKTNFERVMPWILSKIDDKNSLILISLVNKDKVYNMGICRENENEDKDYSLSLQYYGIKNNEKIKVYFYDYYWDLIKEGGKCALCNGKYSEIHCKEDCKYNNILYGDVSYHKCVQCKFTDSIKAPEHLLVGFVNLMIKLMDKEEQLFGKDSDKSIFDLIQSNKYEKMFIKLSEISKLKATEEHKVVDPRTTIKDKKKTNQLLEDLKNDFSLDDEDE